MTNKLTDEQETVRSVFGAYINDLKAYSSKPDRPMFRRLEEVRDKAIEALEQQPKTIQEKQAESKKYEKAFDDGYENGYAQARFDYEQQPRWIPVSERLPKPNEIVLVTIKRWGLHDNDLFRDLPEYTYSTSFTCYNPHFGFNDDVIAWRPLPEPYKPESEE